MNQTARVQEPARIAEARTPDDGDEIDLLALARTLWRGRLLVAGCAILAAALGWAWVTRVAVPTYRATATMVVSQAVDPRGEMDLSLFGGPSVSQNAMNTEMEVVTSRALVGQLVDQLGLVDSPFYNPHLKPVEADPDWLAPVLGPLRGLLRLAPAEAPADDPAAQRRDTISDVQELLTASYVDRSYLFSISATTTDREESLRLANTMAEVYRDDQMRNKIAAAEASAVWLSERTADLRIEIDSRQAEINARRAASALTASDSGLTGFESQLAASEARRFETERALTTAGATVDRLLAAQDASPEMRAEAAGDAQLRTLARSIAAGDATSQARFDLRYGQLLQQAQSERERLTGALETVTGDIAALTDQIAQANEAVGDIRQMDQELQAAQLLYDTFAAQLRETTLRLGSQQSDVRILSEAIEAKKVSPRSAMTLALSLVLGLMAGAAIVLVREALHRTYRTPDELEQDTGITVLGQIPRIPGRTRKKTVSYLTQHPASAQAEAIRNLRTSVLLSDVDNPPKVILTTSSIPGEGKTTVSIALAQNLAGLDRRVLLVEGDIRRRTFSAYFDRSADRPGLLSLLTGKATREEAIWHADTLGVDVLMGEKERVNAADIFASERFRQFVAEMRESYDHVIIDSPPVLVVPDARVIAQLTDAVLFVVNWDRTSRSLVIDGLKQLRTVNARVSGLILSQIDPKGMRRYGYGNRYGAYSRYARGYYDN